MAGVLINLVTFNFYGLADSHNLILTTKSNNIKYGAVITIKYQIHKKRLLYVLYTSILYITQILEYILLLMI